MYDLYDLYRLAHVAGCQPYYLHHLGHVSWVGSVLHRSCITSHNGRAGSRSSTVDRDLSDLSVGRVSIFLKHDLRPSSAVR